MKKKKREVIAIDLGGTNIRIGLVKNHKLVSYIKKKTPKNKKAILEELTSGISKFFNKKIAGIGVSSPGPLENGVIKNTPNLKLKNFDLKRFLIKKFRVRVEVENDANCVALAESKLGCKKKNFFILTLGTGIGGGVIINGRLYKGKGNAGELGHLILDNKTYFEDLAAWKALRKLTKKHFGKEIKTLELLRMKNSKAKKIVDKITDYLGQGIASLINIFDPEIVILAGGIRECGEPLLRLIRKQTLKYVFVPEIPPIIWSKLEEPGMLGASLLLD